MMPRGRQFLHTPGPTNLPDRILRAMDRPAIDHRSPQFQDVAQSCFAGLKQVFKTEHPVLVYSSAGHGAWEAALVNTCSPGDKLLMTETGFFSESWKSMAQNFGLVVEYLPGDWRHGFDPAAIEDCLKKDIKHEIKALAVVHNETSTGILSDAAAARRAIDAAGHPALLMVDTISSLASVDFCMDEWGVDVAVGGSQKGLMLPPGLSFTGISPKAIEASRAATLPRGYWDWRLIIPDGISPGFSYTPAVNMYLGLEAALEMLMEEGLDAVFARHHRLAEATRKAAEAWGMELWAKRPDQRSETITAIMLPEGHSASEMRATCLEKFNVVIPTGLKHMAGRVLRVGHLGDLNEPMILGTLASIEMALKINGVPHQAGGVGAAMDYLAEERMA